ncbi:unnamed protein product [Linum tenue]|uniref:Uncharacterized protein n=1 Tax=Linum tenue TaxID=586396 RepID=A0AAV0NRY4_9ROSI|nr:unnamed protein product [Linum tenue]
MGLSSLPREVQPLEGSSAIA